ncbi:TetR/AcrR family transcriptional regulator [Thalassotalea agariperforans]
MIADKANSSIKRRSKGERTRLHILESAIQVIASHGIKGTTHRAIAKAANIQLSLTTYYFKDIEELIYQAIVLNTEKLLPCHDEMWLSIFKLIESHPPSELKKLAVKKTLAEDISAVFVEQIINNLMLTPHVLAVEQVLFTQTHISHDLFELAEQHQQILLAPYIKFCQYFNRTSAELDAEILFNLHKQQEYQALALVINNPFEQTINKQAIADYQQKLQAIIYRTLGLLLTKK